jgi:hypothetical protein
MRNHIFHLAAFLVALFALQAPAQVIAYIEPEARLITPHELAAFDRIFSTTPEQQSAERALRDAAAAAIRESEARQRKLGDAYRALPPEQRTPKARQELIERTDALDIDAKTHDGLMADLRALLTGEQESRWKRFEYFLRREHVINAESGWGRDPTNVLALVEAVGVNRDDPALAELLDRFERELDAILAEVQAAEDALKAKMRATPRDEEGRGKEEQAAFWAVTKRLAQFNHDSVRRIAALLPEQKAAELRRLYDQVSAPEGLGPQEADLAIRAAPTLHDLDAPTRASVQQIVDEYAPKYDDLSRRIADMERHVRLDPAKPGVDLSQWDPLRMERGSLVSKTHERVRGLLKPEQGNAMMEEGHRQAAEWRAKMSR